MLGTLPLSNYPYVGRLGLQGEVNVATQGASICLDPITEYLRILAPNKECGGLGLTIWPIFVFKMTGFQSNLHHIQTVAEHQF